MGRRCLRRLEARSEEKGGRATEKMQSSKEGTSKTFRKRKEGTGDLLEEEEEERCKRDGSKVVFVQSWRRQRCASITQSYGIHAGLPTLKIAAISLDLFAHRVLQHDNPDLGCWME